MPKHKNNLTQCQIVSVGKRRDGGTRYWCLQHRADATAKYGIKAKKCLRSHISEPIPSEMVTIDTAIYSGGVALWGAVPPIYDTTNRVMDKGIHVHTRKAPSGDKIIDKTYRFVKLIHDGSQYSIDELDAIYFMVSTVFGFPLKAIFCDKCGYSHLDKDWFSVHPHQVHLCAGCGRKFRDVERAIGNPIAVVQEITGLIPPPSKSAKRNLSIDQKDFVGGLQIWASNPAILWSSENNPESGIHIHAYKSEFDTVPTIDDTFSSVIIDGHKLNAEHIRTYMAQRSMPHIKDRITYLKCQCGTEIFCKGEQAYTPITDHHCKSCGQIVRPTSRLRKIIANPIIGNLELLSQTAIRKPQKHNMQLLAEAP